MEELYVARMDMTVGGRQVQKGEIIPMVLGRNATIVFGERTRWTYRLQPGEHGEVCGTDGCQRVFADAGSLHRHRLLVHAPERDARERARLEAAKAAREREEAGETIGGHEVVKVKRGPRGDVPYISPMP